MGQSPWWKAALPREARGAGVDLLKQGTGTTKRWETTAEEGAGPPVGLGVSSRRDTDGARPGHDLGPPGGPGASPTTASEWLIDDQAADPEARRTRLKAREIELSGPPRQSHQKAPQQDSRQRRRAPYRSKVERPRS